MNIQNLIVGSGIAGLTCAYELHKQGQEFLVIEKSSNPGGNWSSHRYKNSIYEFGPNSFMSNAPELLEMIKAISLESRLLSKSFKNSKRYLYLDKKLIPVKPGPGLLLSGLLSPLGILRALLEPFVPVSTGEQEETIDEFFTRRFGKEVARRLVANALQGIWAGDTTRLSMTAAMSSIAGLEKQYGSVIKALLRASKPASKKPPLVTYSFEDGMQSFCHKMVEYLGKENFNFATNIQSVDYEDDHYRVQLADGRILRASNLVIATKSFAAATLVRDFAPDLAESLDQIYYAPIALCAYTIPKKFFSARSQNKINAFGFISGDTWHIGLGTIWSSQLFPERNLEDEYLMLSFAGGSRNPQILGWQQEVLWKKLLEEQIEVLDPLANKKLMLEDFTIVDTRIIERAIPQYHLGHSRLLEDIQMELARYHGLHLVGNYLAGVSIADTVRYSLASTERSFKVPASQI